MRLCERGNKVPVRVCPPPLAPETHPSFCHILCIPSPLSLSFQVERQPVSFSTSSRSELSTICPVNVTEILPVRMLRETASSVSERGGA